MIEPTRVDEVPTFFANIVTSTFRGDEVTLELRHYVDSHRELFEKVGQGKPLPVIDWRDVYKREPVARIVMTYNAAKGLQEWLARAVPEMAKARLEQ